MNLIENRWLYYPALVVMAFLLSTGPVCVTYQSADQVLGPAPLLMLIPLTLLTLTSFFVTKWWLIPRFLYSNQLTAFFISVFAVAITVEYAAVWIDVATCDLLDIPRRVKNPSSPLILLFSAIACVFLVLLMVSLSVWDLYTRHLAQEREENRLSAILHERMQKFRQRIPMKKVGEELSRAAALTEEDPEATHAIIRRLSSLLRHSLYDEEPLLTSSDTSSGNLLSDYIPSRMEEFLTARRFRPVRHLSVILFTVFCATGLLFEQPDCMEVSPPFILAVVVFFLIMLLTIYFNFYVLFPLFLKGGLARTIAWWLLFLPLIIVTIVGLNSIIKNGPVNPFGVVQPWYVYPLGMLGTLASMFLQVIGCGAIMLLRVNIRGRWRLSRLCLETRQLEHQTLKSQVNPHFLFNVFNNAGILSYDDPEEARLVLSELRHFLEYMLDDVERFDTSIAEEASLIKSFLTLEKSSGRALDAEITCPDSLYGIRIPTLLLIPLVENAVKHSVSGPDGRFIKISFSLSTSLFSRQLVFTCTNSSLPADLHFSNPNYPLPPRAGRQSGLGLYNIRRRLKLLFGEDASLVTNLDDEVFNAVLKIPVSI